VQKEKTITGMFNGFVVRFWWVFLFLVICFVVYDNNIKEKNKEIQIMKNRLKELSLEKELTLEEKEELLSKINSQSDPSWIEMVLIKELGVVPDGQLKVHFKK
jgi:hypothetical protein